MTAHVAHDSKISVGERTFDVRRDMELARRIEQNFGPIRTLERALRAEEVTLAQISALYAEVLRGVEAGDRPSQASIEAHVLDVGAVAASEPIIHLLLALFMGHAGYQKLQDAMQQLDDAKGEAESGGVDDTDPPSPAGSRPGLPFLKSRTT